MKMSTTIINTARKLRKYSTHENYPMVAFVIRGGSIISSGVNHYSVYKHPFTTHAEVDAAQRVRDDLSGAKVVVVRFLKNNHIADAKPCDECVKYLRNRGIRRVKYTTTAGIFGTMKI